MMALASAPAPLPASPLMDHHPKVVGIARHAQTASTIGSRVSVVNDGRVSFGDHHIDVSVPVAPK